MNRLFSNVLRRGMSRVNWGGVARGVSAAVLLSGVVGYGRTLRSDGPEFNTKDGTDLPNFQKSYTVETAIPVTPGSSYFLEIPLDSGFRVPVIIVKTYDGKVSAFRAQCPFDNTPLLDDALILKEKLICVEHGCEFNIKTGEPEAYPALYSLPRFEVREINAQKFELRIPNLPPLAIEPVYSPQNPEDPRRVLVIGAGAAGFAVSESLRRIGYGGEITVVTSQTSLPFIKKKLADAKTPDDQSVYFKDEAFYQDASINILYGRKVRKLKFPEQNFGRVQLEDNTELEFDALVICSGAGNSEFRNSDSIASNAITLNNIGDLKKSFELLPSAKNLVVLGLNLDSAELASKLKERHPDKNVLVAETRELSNSIYRSWGPNTHDTILNLLQKQGIQFFPEGSASLEITGEELSKITLQRPGTEDKTELKPDIAYIFDEAKTNISFIDLRRFAAVRLEKGRIPVYPDHRTSANTAFAAGQIASLRSDVSGKPTGHNSFIDSMDQGEKAALGLLGFVPVNRRPPLAYYQIAGHKIYTLGSEVTFDQVVTKTDPVNGEFISYFGLKKNLVKVVASRSQVKKILLLREASHIGIPVLFDAITKREDDTLEYLYKEISTAPANFNERALVKEGVVMPEDNRLIFLESDYYEPKDMAPANSPKKKRESKNPAN